MGVLGPGTPSKSQLTISGLFLDLGDDPMVDSLRRPANDSMITTRKILC